jgi:hypothetical protein
MEIFENAANASAQLLKVERLGSAGDEAMPLAAALLFTFDVGRALLSAEPAHGRLSGGTTRHLDLGLAGGAIRAALARDSA